MGCHQICLLTCLKVMDNVTACPCAGLSIEYTLTEGTAVDSFSTTQALCLSHHAGIWHTSKITPHDYGRCTVTLISVLFVRPPPDAKPWRSSTVVIPVVQVWQRTPTPSLNPSPLSRALTSYGQKRRLRIWNMRCYEKWPCCTIVQLLAKC